VTGVGAERGRLEGPMARCFGDSARPGARRERRRVVVRLTRLVLAAALGISATEAAEPRVVQSERHTFRVVVLVEGLEHAWGLAFLPDGRLLVTERPGRLRLIANGRLDPQPIGGLPAIAAYGQGGLLDVALHPRYAETGWVYLAYAAPGAGGAGTEVLRGRLRDGRLEDVEVIFRLQPKSGAGQHFGSRLVFDRSGHLYVTLGDRGERERAQRLDDHRGKIVRLHDDGRVPVDNPFRTRAGALPEIFSYGNRNVQGAALHPATGLLWAHEHGPRGGDEVNVIRAGQNYGWPVITFGREYGTGFRIGEGTSRADVAAPLHVWIPSIAPSGMAFYAGDRFPQWRGNLFVGALVDKSLVRLELDGERIVREERLMRDVVGRIRDVRSGPDGYLYVLSDANRGVLARLEPVQP
jgi:glucose/arabinose dehydrogenase